MKDGTSDSPLPGIRPMAMSDPDVDEAVVDLLEDIVERLSFEAPSPRDSDRAWMDAGEHVDDEPSGDEDAWLDDRITPEIRSAIPPPPPDSAERITHPEILSQALVYADEPVDGDSDDPSISVTSLLDVVELESDAAPLSLRPISRTSFPEPPAPSKRRRFAALLVALAAAMTLSVVWLSQGPSSTQTGQSAAAAQLFAQDLPRYRGLALRSPTAGARLFLDGTDRGPLPILLHDLPAGRYDVRVEAPKHRAVSREVVVPAGGIVDLGELALAPAEEQIRIELTPTNAYLNIADVESGESTRYAGPWPRVIALGPGGYDVMAFRGGFRTAAMRLWVAPGRKLTTWRIELGQDDIYEK